MAERAAVAREVEEEAVVRVVVAMGSAVAEVAMGMLCQAAAGLAAPAARVAVEESRVGVACLVAWEGRMGGSGASAETVDKAAG